MLAKLARELALHLHRRKTARPRATGPLVNVTFDQCLALMDAGRIDAARACYEALLEAEPLHAAACNNLGIINHGRGALAEAEALFRRAIAIDPRRAQPYVNLGNILQDQCDLEGALAQYEAALRIDPDLPTARYSRATALLALQRFEEGWNEYEWRWHLPGASAHRRRFPRPRWDGIQDVRGKTVLVHAEQGYGDSIHFVRYAAMLAAREARVIVECQASLQRLFAAGPGMTDVVAAGDPLPDFDYEIPMMSLPAAFGTSATSIPAAERYLVAPADAAREWQSRIDAIGGGLKVGVVWSGNPTYAGDSRRSMPFECVLEMLSTRGCVFFSLQKGAAAEQARAVRGTVPLHDFTDELRDFADTAAMVSALDAVVAVDTAVAHLVGALGRPVYTALPYSPDWRWGVDGESTPWYPTMRLMRQPAPGQWLPVVRAITRSLAARAARAAEQSP